MDKNDLEALKMLQDWSKWLVTVDVAVIVGVSAAQSSVVGVFMLANVLLAMATVSFAVSVVAATWLLLALPGIAQRLPPPAGHDIFMMGTMAGVGVRLVYLALAEHAAFLLGILFLSCSFVARISEVSGILITTFVVSIVVVTIVVARHRGAPLRVI